MRRLAIALLALSLLPLTAVTSAAATTYELRLSLVPDRSGSALLDGTQVAGDIYVFTAPDTGVKKVSFWVDEPTMSTTPLTVERKAPFDLAGTARDGTALPYDTTVLAGGTHTVTASIDLTSGGSSVVEATFTVDNEAPALTFAPDALALSAVEGGSPTAATTTVDTNDATATTVELTSSAPWLSVSPATAGTPADVTVTADPAGLAAGTYSGSVTASASGYLDAVLPVTLTVTAVSSTYELQLSYLPDRSDPVPLDGQAVGDDVYVFSVPESGVSRVRFWLDDPSLSGTPYKTENAAPFDLAGTGSNGNALPFDTTTLADGTHTVSAVVDRTDGTSELTEATFTVDNTSPSILASPSSHSFTVLVDGAPVQATMDLDTSDGTTATVNASSAATWLTLSASSGSTPTSLTVTVDPTGLPSGTYTSSVTVTADGYRKAVVPVTLSVVTQSSTYSLKHSAAADRSSPVALEGATVAGDLYAFTAPDTNVRKVRFWLDDPNLTGDPDRVEFDRPFDLAGTATDGTAVALDTTGLAEGAHTVSAVLDLADGTAELAQATFTVDNLPPGLTFLPRTLDLVLDEGGAAVGQTVDLTLDADGTAEFALTSDAAWLTASPTTGTAPTQITVTADPTGLDPGVYTGRLTATSEGLTSGTLDVTATVGDTGGCSPMACSEILVGLPYIIDFPSDHGGLHDTASLTTGFTYVDPPSNGSGYLRHNLAIDQAAGTLNITTTPGLNTTSSNSQDNAIAVGIDAPSQDTVLTTTIRDVPTGTGNFEQGGLWFGNDQDNYVKLTVQSTSTGPRVEFLLEVDGSISKTLRKSVVGLEGSDVTFKLTIVPADRSITATFSVNGGAFDALGTVIAPGEFFSFDAAGIDPTIGTRSFGGIFASHRNGPAPLVYTFDDFSAVAAEDDVVQTSVSFDRVSFPVSTPTSMAWGPDGRLYVTELFGSIHAITLDENKQVVSDQVFDPLGSRLTLGLTIDPASTADDVILWVAHSNASLSNGEVNSSTVTRLSGADLSTRQDVITGLPRALANHAINSIHFGPDGRLYIAQGGNTGAGAPNEENTEFGDRPEQPLSAALLVADVKAAGFEGDCATPLYQFGVPATCDLQVFSSGLRNTYDFVIHSNGHIYGPDNGLGVTGTYPPSPIPDCTGLADASLHDPGEQPDILNLLEQGRYYGHPDPYRDECVFKDGRWQGVDPLPNYTPPIHNLGNNRSANGTIEYLGDAFCGDLRNEILIANYSVGDDITRIELASDGRSVVATSSLVGGFNNPLPLTQSPDGTIYVGELGAGQVTALIPQDPGCWETRTPMPDKVLDAGGTALDGRLYVVGGKTGAGHVSTVYVYDPSTDAWTTPASLPGDPVENPAVAALDGKLYAFGGSTAAFSGAVRNAAVYDPATDAWTPLAPMPTARSGAAAQAIDGRIYVAGGMGGDGASLAVLEVYDPSTDTWSIGAPLSTRRDNPGSAVLNGQLYVFGGRTRNADGTSVNDTLNAVESYDPTTDAWTARTSMPTGRRTMMVGTLDGRAQVMGGEIRGDGGAFDQNEEYDPATDTWRILTPLPTARHGGVAGTIGGVVYVVGGGPVGGLSHTDVNEAFSFQGDSVRLLASPSRLTFDALLGGDPVSATVDVSTSDAAPASVTVTTSGEPWLSVSPSSLTSPGLLTVTADPAGLDPGTYSASVTLTAAGYPDQSVPVTLQVSDPTIVATPSNLSLSADEGGSSVSATVELSTNDGGTPTVTLVTSGDGWLDVSPSSLTAPGQATVTADPTGLAAGTYSATVTASAEGYPDLAIPVSFTVTGNPGLDLWLSSSPDRSNPVALEGQAVAGDIYVFTAPDDGVLSVDFWVDDPTMTKTPTKREANAPFDLAGTNRDGTARPYSTTQLADGTHTVTAALYLSDGTTAVVDAGFAVDNEPGGTLTFDRSATSMAAPVGGGPVAETASVSTDNLSAQAVTIASDAAWLTVSPTSGSTPLDVTLSADPEGMAEGTYTAAVTATADDPAYSSATLTVTLHVRSSLVPDQVHLAWEQDPATTLTVVWRTWDDDTASTVEFRPQGSSTWQAVTGEHRTSGTAGQLHQATLSGLQAGSTYEYRVIGDHGTTSQILDARTAPASGGAFDLVFVADTGIDGREDGLTTGTAQVIDEIAALDADLVLAGGDFAYYNTETRFDTLDQAIDAWFNQMEPIAAKAPMMPAYGNHEVLLSEGFEPWAARFPTPEGHQNRQNYSFDVGDVHFVSILHIYDSGGMPQSQLDWITSDIADAQAGGARWIIPFMHASPYTDGTNHPANLEVRAQLAPIFEAAGIPLVLSTHDQAFERSYPLIDMPDTNTATSTSLTCYELGVDGTVWVKSSPGGKLSNKNAGFSPFASSPPPAWTAARDNTMHNFAHLAFGSDGSVTVTTYGVTGDGSQPVVLDRFTYGVDPCAA